MRKNFGVKPWTVPQPVFILATYDENGNPDVMNAAWGGIASDDLLMICVGGDHKTTKNLFANKALTVSMADTDYVKECDFAGVVSGLKDPKKFEKTGFTAIPSEFLKSPLIAQLPFAVECTVQSYDEETCMMICKIVNVSIDESILTEDGKHIDVDKWTPIVFDCVNHTYRALGKEVGRAFYDGLALR